MALRILQNGKFKNSNFVFGLLLILGIIWLPTSQATLKNSELVQKLSARNYKFAFKYFKILAAQDDAIISPFSISVALTMTSFGAHKNTLKQLNDALELNGFKDHMDIANAYSSALESLDLKGNITLVISNRIFIEKSYQVKQQFKDILENQFHSVVQSVQFLNDCQNLNNEISKWVDKTTQSKIKALTPIGGGGKYTGAVLVSAIYFKGKWKTSFDKKKTKTDSFQLAKGNKVSVSMMNIETYFQYSENKILDSKILKLDFSGSRIAMYVFLPNKLDRCKTLKQKLTPELFETIKKSMKSTLVTLKLPKLSWKCTRDMSSDLPPLQITDLVTEAKVDLNGIANVSVSGSHLFVQKVLYASYVELDEKGVEAVGSPSQGSAAQASPQLVGGEPLKFYADHPFVFVIYDTLTNFILFIGSVDERALK